MLAPHLLSAAGRGKTLPFYCAPMMAYQELFGGLATSDIITDDVRKPLNVRCVCVDDDDRDWSSQEVAHLLVGRLQ